MTRNRRQNIKDSFIKLRVTQHLLQMTRNRRQNIKDFFNKLRVSQYFFHMTRNSYNNHKYTVPRGMDTAPDDFVRKMRR